jgi:hypothetical protein
MLKGVPSRTHDTFRAITNLEYCCRTKAPIPETQIDRHACRYIEKNIWFQIDRNVDRQIESTMR